MNPSSGEPAAPASGPGCPRPDLPIGADTLSQVKHIVILMMQGHSYDNYLGMMSGRGEGFPLGPGGEPISTNPDPDGERIAVHELSRPDQLEHAPWDSISACQAQWDDGACDGFVRSVETSAPGRPHDIAMGYWTERTLPFYYALARTFPVADHWFSSYLGPAVPNRRFLIAGTAHGLTDDLPYSTYDYPAGGTIFDRLTEHGISWADYQHVSRTRVLAVRFLGHRGLRIARRALSVYSSFVPFAATSTRGRLKFTADVYPLGLLAAARHVRPIREFFGAAATGQLPSVCVVDPDFDGGSERNPGNIQTGEAFVHKVIQAVMTGAGWAGTLLIWLYDNHGGYYDHVPPPQAVPPDDVAWPQPVRPVGDSRPIPVRPTGPAGFERRPRLRDLRDASPRGGGVPVRAAELRVLAGLRPHIGAQAHRGKVESPAADP